MDDPNPLRKEKVTGDLHDINESIDFCLHPRRAGLGSYCQLDVDFGSSDGDVRRVV